MTKDIAIEPSPTADATRLILDERTLPTANTPDKRVSNEYEKRFRSQWVKSISQINQIQISAEFRYILSI